MDHGVPSGVVQALLDRGVELAELRRRLDVARAGAGRVIVIEGPAGIGKSALLDVAVGEAPLVLRARAHPLERDAGWAVARQLFERLRAQRDWADLTSGAAALADRVLAPEDAEPADAGDARHAAVRGLVWLLTNLCARSPVVLAVDDAHWADPASLHWLAVLAASLHELPAAVVCAVRAGEPAAAPELLAELLAAAPEPPVRPRPLGPTATATLVRARSPAAHETFVRACHEVTGGNPFLLVTLLAQLAADRVEPTRDAAAGLGTFGPEQVARAVERQLTRLPGGSGDLARAVAVLGPGTPLRRAAAVAGLDLPTATTAADALRAAGLVDPGPELSLVHPLIASALYAGIPPGRRGVCHAIAARVLAAEGAGPESVGLQLLHSEPAGDPATARTLREAAARSTARGAPLAAAAFLHRALAEPPAAPEAADIHLDLGLALAWAVQPRAYEHLAAAVEAAPSPGRRSEIALRGARALGLLGEFEHAFELGRLGLEHAGDAPPGLCARLEAEMVTDGWLQRTTNETSRALTDSPRFTDLGLWRVNAAMRCAIEAGPAERSLEIIRPLLADGALDREPESLLGTTATLCLILDDDLDAARVRYDRIIEIAAPRGWLIALAHGCMLRAFARLRCGEIRDAEADARLGFEAKLRVAQPPAILWTLAFFVDALVEFDQPDQAEGALAAAGLHGDPPAGVLAGPLVLQARARLRLAQSRARDALADACAAGERAGELPHPQPGHGRLAAVRGRSTGQSGRPEGRRDARAGTPGPGAGRGDGEHVRGRSARPRRLRRPARAPRAAGARRRRVAASPARLEHTRALVDLGAALRRSNRRGDARAPAPRARPGGARRDAPAGPACARRARGGRGAAAPLGVERPRVTDGRGGPGGPAGGRGAHEPHHRRAPLRQ